MLLRYRDKYECQSKRPQDKNIKHTQTNLQQDIEKRG